MLRPATCPSARYACPTLVTSTAELEKICTAQREGERRKTTARRQTLHRRDVRRTTCTTYMPYRMFGCVVEARNMAKRKVRLNPKLYRGTSLIRNSETLGPYSRTMPRALWCPWGGVLPAARPMPGVWERCRGPPHGKAQGAPAPPYWLRRRSFNLPSPNLRAYRTTHAGCLGALSGALSRPATWPGARCACRCRALTGW